MAINLRSPFNQSVQTSNLSYATLDLYIWQGLKTSVPASPEYSLKKSSYTPQGQNPVALFEVAELIRDFLDITFDGDYDSQCVWVRSVYNGYNSSDVSIIDYDTTTIGFDGYEYFEEVLLLSALAITNRTIYALDDNIFRIPINNSFLNNDITISFLRNGNIISSETYNGSNDTNGQLKYVSSLGDDINYDNYKERVLNSGGVFEDSVCLQQFFNEFSIDKIDKVIVADNYGVTTLDIKTISECKYEPKKVTFINKFGALQDLYFFKKSVEKMNVKKENYKANISDARGNYNYNNHVYRDYNVTAKENVSLSSGYLNEEYNEVFKQMMLSEKVWLTNITDNGEQVLPINVKTSNITYKTSLNDRLVEYTIDFDYSFDVIKNIR